MFELPNYTLPENTFIASEILSALAIHARKTPDKVLIDNGEHALSAKALWDLVQPLRARVAALDCVSIALVGDNTISWIISDLALLGLPVRVIPIPSFFSDAQVAHVLESANIDTIIGPKASLDSFVNYGVAQWWLLDDAHNIHAARLVRVKAPSSVASTAHAVTPHLTHHYEKITFTSGSTGNAKGVRLSLATLENTAQAIAQAMAPLAIESHLGVLPYATLLENIAGMYAPLLQGVRIHVRRMEQVGLASPELFNPFQLLSTILRTQPQATILVPQLLLALVTLRQRGVNLGDSLRFIAIGGGKVSPVLIEQARQLNLPVYEGYGLSECGSVVALNLPGAERIGSVGQPLSHCRVRIADNGEIMICGSVMSGYLVDDAPENEAESSHEIATGDLGHLDKDGFLYIDGRKKNLFITAFGRNVNPEWLEAELSRYLCVRQVAVFGEGLTQPVAIIVSRAGFSDSDVEQTITECNHRLPDYARIGRVVLARTPFTVDNGLATPNGRLRRQAIAVAFQDQLASPHLVCGETP